MDQFLGSKSEVPFIKDVKIELHLVSLVLELIRSLHSGTGMTATSFAKDDLTLSGEIIELSLDQLDELSGGRVHPRAGGNGGPLMLAIGAFEVGLLIGTEISTIPPVRTGLEYAGDAVGTWLGKNGIWW